MTGFRQGWVTEGPVDWAIGWLLVGPRRSCRCGGAAPGRAFRGQPVERGFRMGEELVLFDDGLTLTQAGMN
jgi:hypothetical protein